MPRASSVGGAVVLLGLACASGCVTAGRHTVVPAPVPRELNKVSQPPYVIEPPDLLQIDLITAVPRPPYRVRPLDVLTVTVTDAIPDQPVSGPVAVEPDGRIFLGPYGSVQVAGLTIDEARAEAEKQIAGQYKTAVVNVALGQSRASQQVRGPRLVQGDGTINMGVYGDVRVVGLTVPEARRAIEARLAEFYQDPEVSVSIVGYNSKLFYVVFDYGGAGQQVLPQPLTGTETVLDAVGRTPGLPAVADQKRIWVARPGPDGCPPQVLPVDWQAVVACGDTRTNYQLLPGDRVYVGAYPLSALDVAMARVFAPIERVFGITLLGTQTVNSIKFPNQGGLGGF